MRIVVGDEVDQLLVKVIIHEFSRCQLAFNLFISSKNRKYINIMKSNLELDLMTYNAYALFLQHLYEYFQGCIKRDIRDTSNVPHETIDALINNEVEKILRNWRQEIDNGFASKWANHRSYYEDNCPIEFGRDFRNIRNNLAHVDYRRINGGNRITMTEFYKKYHKYIILLYDNGRK